MTVNDKYNMRLFITILLLTIHIAIGGWPRASVLGTGSTAHGQSAATAPEATAADIKNTAPQTTVSIGGLFIQGEDHLHHWEITEAGEAARKILAIQPDSPEGLYLLAQVRFYQGRYEEALKLLEGPPQNFLDGRTLFAFITEIYETAKDFKERTTEHFIIRYIPGKDEVLLEDAGRAFERAYSEIGSDLRYLPEEKIMVEIYPNTESFSTASTLTLKEIETSGTVAICHFNRIMIMSPRLLLRGYPWLDTLAHEYVHYVITKRTRNLTPIWFHEGLAKYEESRWKSPLGNVLTPIQSHLLAQAIEQDYFITFEQMHPSLAKLKSAEDAALAFAEVLTAMRYIVEKGSYPLLNKILDGIASGQSVEDAVEDGLGVAFVDFERGWKAYLKTLGLKKIPGLRLMPLKIKSPGAKEESPTEIEAADARKFTMLGDLLEEEHRPDAALLEYEKARQFAGLGSPQILNKLARAYLQNHRYEQAQKVLKEALRYYPNYVTLYITQGELYRKIGMAERAIESFKMASHINPFNPIVYQRLARLYTDAGDKEAAKKALKKLAVVLKESSAHRAEKKGTE